MYLVHEQMKDVFIEVLEHKIERTRIRWWNLGFTNKPWMIPVKKDQLDQWVDTRNLIGMCKFNPNQPDTHPGRQHGKV